MVISLLNNKDIDKKKYDACINRSLQGTVYALSWYLDVVAPGWKLLASEDYEYVMPLPYKKKFGIAYSLQPPICQQLGVFWEDKRQETGNRRREIVALFLKKIPVLYYNLQLNAGNKTPAWGAGGRPNYLLSLDKSHEDIFTAYKSRCRRHIRKARRSALSVSNDTERIQFFSFLAKHSPYQQIEKMIPLYEKIIEASGKTEITKVCNDQGEIVAVALFLYWKSRAYYLISAASPEGKKKQAMSLLIDSFIQTHAGSEMILDFEGSTIPEIACFFEGFGAKPEYYPQIESKGLVGKVFSFAQKIK